MRVDEICSKNVIVVSRDESVSTVAQLMREYHVGAVVVTEQTHGRRQPVGIVTDRDLVVELLAKGLDMDAVTAGDLTAPNLVTVPAESSVLEAIEIMSNRGVRRLPVVDGTGRELVGILAVDDVLAVLSRSVQRVASLIRYEQDREKTLRR
ncbi:MAG TPA: CBS domain-containing protein [Gammaproteobacteria bacterium]|nr:CBS domain-containing protein [Gammaproteobacteria bacterium]